MKKIILTILVTAMLLGILSACTKTEINNENLNGGMGTPSSGATQMPETTPGTTESVSPYQPGKWTIAGYTSEWLNMSYIRPGSLKITQDSIAIQKQFDELRKAGDPYWAVTEMTFKGVFDIKYAPTNPITLTVMLLENADKTAKECADEYERGMKAAAIELGVKEDILDEKEAEIIFLGERYLVRYTKIRTLGRDREHCRLYLVKDGYRVMLTYEHLSSYFILEDTFCGFSALNGNDYKGICSICDKEVIYKVVATDRSVCLECCFGGRYTRQPENDQTEQETTAPTTPSSQAPIIAPTERPTEEPTTAPTTKPPASCLHNYAKATCTAPKTCTKCGATEGSSVGHSWSAATCTVSQTCTVCGATTGGLADHVWKEATCTEPSMCTVCWQTSGEPYGHSMNATKCRNCDHSDFSTFAKKYTSVGAYDFKTGADFEVTNVSLSSYGVLTFTFQGKDYSVTLVQARADSYEANFDCYENGIRIQDAEARINMNGSDYTFHFKWANVNGCRLYFNTRG